MDIEEEDTPLIDGARGAQNGGDPFVDVVALGAGAAKKVESSF